MSDGGASVALDEAVRRLAAEAAPGLLDEALAAGRQEAAEILKAKVTRAMMQAVEDLLDGREAMVQEAERLLDGSGQPAVHARPETPELSGLYVYGITRLEVAAALAIPAGVDGAPVDVIPAADLAAVVSRLAASTDWGIEGKGDAAINALAPRARAHEAVLEQIMDHGAVLPLRFGVLYPDREGLRVLLQERADSLGQALEGLDGQSEWGLTITSDRRPGEADDSVAGADGRDYLARRRDQRRMADERADRLARAGTAIHERLLGSCTAAVLHRQTASWAGPGQVVLRGSYLVRNEAAPAFKRACEECLTEGAGEFDLSGDLTGPWPPYHFCEISLDEVPA